MSVYTYTCTCTYTCTYTYTTHTQTIISNFLDLSIRTHWTCFFFSPPSDHQRDSYASSDWTHIRCSRWQRSSFESCLMISMSSWLRTPPAWMCVRLCVQINRLQTYTARNWSWPSWHRFTYSVTIALYRYGNFYTDWKPFKLIEIVLA